MKDKYYGLTNKQNEGVKDTIPSWMDTFFKNSTKPKDTRKKHPFEGIDDPILNPKRIGLDK